MSDQINNLIRKIDPSGNVKTPSTNLPLQDPSGSSIRLLETNTFPAKTVTKFIR
ncbi:hypothetical protein LEP1GSC088_0800 [Leptospira interrogans str. L1207]|nr:hypothetical protein LEP1GSC088_0800 [Leptospira interrogans str. L1207]